MSGRNPAALILGGICLQIAYPSHAEETIVSKRFGAINRLARLVVDIATGQMANDPAVPVGHAKGARAEACWTAYGAPR